MKLLIVDDEIFAIQGILDSVDWSRLPFEEVLTATSMAKAEEQFDQNEIAVMLCDIEMPHGNGLELVGWVSEHSPKTKNIFLTCHDDFYFAKQAIQLKCVDYLLKPAEPDALIEVLGRTAKSFEEDAEKERFVDYGRNFVQSSADSAEDEDADVVSKVEAYIKSHIEDELSVDDMARHVYVSPDHLSRLFKKRYGKSLKDYIIDTRMTLAADLLKNSSDTVSMIASKAGYPNYSYFTRKFKEIYGLSPREYQQKYQKEK